jgi:hypothetical protein
MLDPFNRLDIAAARASAQSEIAAVGQGDVKFAMQGCQRNRSPVWAGRVEILADSWPEQKWADPRCPVAAAAEAANVEAGARKNRMRGPWKIPRNIYLFISAPAGPWWRARGNADRQRNGGNQRRSARYFRDDKLKLATSLLFIFNIA